jgi:hypothetical protein
MVPAKGRKASSFFKTSLNVRGFVLNQGSNDFSLKPEDF